jgi:hypothetical protein
MGKLCCLGVWSVAAACVALPAPALGAPSAVNEYANATTGIATRAPDQSASSTPGSTVGSRGTRQIPRSQSGAAPAIAAPRAASVGLSAKAPLLANFNGVSSRDSAVTNFNQEFEPPDQGLCAGNGFVVEMVNSAYTVYRPNGTVVTGPFNINGPFDEGLTQFTSDPRCYYDATTNTWFATILFISGGDFGPFGNTSHLDIAVNNSGDPANPWTDYQIDTTDPKGNGCPCFGDQPTLGIDPQNLYVTTNEFSINGPQFNGAQIYAFSKRDLASLNPTVHFVHFGNLSIGGAIATSVQPALTTGTPSAEYFLNALDPNGTFDQRIGLWAMTNTSAVSSGGTPKLSSVVLSSEAYGVPPNAQQRGATSLLNTGDDRMQQTQFTNGSIWGELTTGVTISGDSTQRAGAAWFRVRPHLSGGKLVGGTLPQQGYVAVSGHYFIYPALQVAPNGAAAIVGTLSGSNVYPSAAFTTLAPGATSFGPVKIAATGATNYDPSATRWGDYSWAVLDPSGTSFWLATEYIPPKSSQTPDGLKNWGTRVLNLSAG